MEAWPCSGGIPLNLPESIPHNYKAHKVKAGTFFCRGYRAREGSGTQTAESRHWIVLGRLSVSSYCGQCCNQVNYIHT